MRHIHNGPNLGRLLPMIVLHGFMAGLTGCAGQGPSAPTRVAPPHIPTPDITPASPTPATTPTQLPEIAAPPSGLLVAIGSLVDSAWRLEVVGEDGQLHPLLDQSAPPLSHIDFAVSPDGKQILYVDQGDVWLLDIASRHTRNVTQTPERSEKAPRWWPDRRDQFVCSSTEADPNSAYLASLTLVGMDGTYQVLDEVGTLAAPPAPGPDGISVAYSRFVRNQNVPAIYVIGQGWRAFSPAQAVPWATRFGEASWSPDGKYLGWALFGVVNGREQTAEVIFDLAGGEPQIVHSYDPMGIEGYPPAPQWSAGSEWFAFYTMDDDWTQRGAWIASAGAREARLVGPAFGIPTYAPSPAISPDGHWIAAPTAQFDVGLIDTTDWTAWVWHPPETVKAVGWVAQPPSR